MALKKILLILIILILIMSGVKMISNTIDNSPHSDGPLAVTITDVTGSFYDWDDVLEFDLKTEAIFTDIPSDITGYILKTTYYDENNTQLTQDTTLLSDLIFSFEIDETTSTETFADVTIEGKNISVKYVTVEVIKDGKIITSDNFTIDKNKIYSYKEYLENPKEDSDSDSSSSSSDSSDYNSYETDSSDESSSSSSYSSSSSSNMIDSEKNSFYMDDGNPTWEELEKLYPSK